MNKNKIDYISILGWTFALPGILATFTIGLLTIFGIAIINTGLSNNPSEEIALGILGIILLLMVVSFLILTPIWILSKKVRRCKKPYRPLLIILALILANILPGTILAYSLWQEQKNEKDGSYSITFLSLEEGLRKVPESKPRITNAKDALGFALRSKEAMDVFETPTENGWIANATSYKLLSLEERGGGKVPEPPPFRVEIKPFLKGEGRDNGTNSVILTLSAEGRIYKSE
jgi:hypothetical protein